MRYIKWSYFIEKIYIHYIYKIYTINIIIVLFYGSPYINSYNKHPMENTSVFEVYSAYFYNINSKI